MTLLSYIQPKLSLSLATLLLVALASYPTAPTPMSADEQKVREVIGYYFKGAETSDPSYFERAFDVENAHMKAVGTDSTGLQRVRTIPIANAIASWTRNPPEETWGKIHSVDIIDGKLAHATIEILFRGYVYVDVMALYKLNDDWKIVYKTYVSRGRVSDS